MMEKIIGKKEKWTNKGTDYPYVADSLIHFVYRFRVLSSSGSRDFDVQSTHQR